MTTEFLFRAKNQHSDSCGTPPSLDEPPDDSNVFRSYFENEHGEQWILLHDAKTDRVTIHAGDCGWDDDLTVKPLKDAIKSLPNKYADSMLEYANSQGDTGAPVVCGRNGPSDPR